MPVQVFSEDLANDPPQDFRANVVYGGVLGLLLRRRCNVDMGEFAVAHDPDQATALGTTGAGPCQIIVVHKAKGWGALGHHSGHGGNPLKVVSAVNEMIDKLGGGPIAAIVFAAGDQGSEQSAFEQTIMASVCANHAGAQVTWAKPPQGANEAGWSSCFYLPQAGQIGLFSSATDTPFSGGSGSNLEGITRYQYL